MGSVPPLLSFLLMIVSGGPSASPVRHRVSAGREPLAQRAAARKADPIQDAERALVERKAKAVGRKSLLELDNVVSPDTLMRWHRRFVAQKWNFTHRCGVLPENDRHKRKRSKIFTTNKPLAAWGRALHDEDLAHAVVERVLECGRLLQLDGL